MADKAASSPDYTLRLPGEVAFEETDDHKNVLEFINRVKSDYYESQQFKNYKKRCETIKHLTNQLWENGKKTTKFGFRTAMSRATRDNYRDSLHDLFDLDEWVYLTPLSSDPMQEQYVSELEDFTNNLMRQIGYKRMWFRRLDYLPDYGWSPAYGEFKYGEGYQLRPNQNFQTNGGLPFDAAWATTLNKPVSNIIHPYAWFTSNLSSSWDFQGQGRIKRWYLCDVYAAEKKQTKDGKPIYNPKALKALKATLGKQQQERDQYAVESKGQDINDQDLKFDTTLRMPYVDVTYWHGSLGACRGHYDDPAVYLIECTKTMVLRMAEDPLGYQYEEMTHAKTHAFRSNPFSQSFLDATREHQRMTDLMLNLSIENQVDAMHRFWWLNEDDILDPNDLYNPRGLNTFILAAREGARPPERFGDTRSGALQDLDQILRMIDHDKQMASATDQEIGLGNQNSGGDSSTATEASILKSASSKKIRATCKRISEEAMIPEIKYLVLQAMLYFTPDQLRTTSKDGQIIKLTPQHMQAFVNNTEFRANDRVTRDLDAEALKEYNFYMSGLKISQQLASPDVAIKMLRSMGRKLGIDSLDDVIPPPQIPEIGPGGPAMPGQPGAAQAAVPGAPGMPGPQLAPPGMAPPQPTFNQPQAGNFNVAVPA